MTFQKLSSLQLSPGVGNDGLFSAVFNNSTGFIYFGTLSGNVVEVNTSNFSESNFITLNAGETALKTASIDIGNGFVYFGTDVTPSAVIVKVQMSPLMRITSVTGGVVTRHWTASDIDIVNGFLYIGPSNAGGTDRLKKFNLSPLAFVTELIGFSPCINSTKIDGSNTFLYHAGRDTPISLTKVRLSDFTVVGGISLGSGRSTTMVIDKTNGFLYIGTGLAAPNMGEVRKVRLSDFTLIGTIVVDAGVQLVSSIIDESNQFAYFGTNTSPGRIHKIDLSTFTKVDTIILDSGENDLRSAVIDINNKVGYFGTYTSPGIVIKVDLSTTVPTLGSPPFRKTGASVSGGIECGKGKKRR